MFVEQAIFTSARTERLHGYQLVAATEGISAEDCQSLTHWCPAHDSLVERSPKATSVNFHPLASENYCISRTRVAGAEYSGRGGGRVFTQCFVVPLTLLENFASNPFRVLEAISAAGHVKCYDQLPKQLEPFPLIGRASVMDRRLLRKLQAESHCSRLTTVVAAVTGKQSVCIIDQRSPDIWLQALFSVLPMECRTQVSFCTNLQFSGRRPFRCMSRRTLPHALRKSSQRSGVTLLNMDERAGSSREAPQGWALLVDQILQGENLRNLERLLRCKFPGLKIEDLDALAYEILHERRSKAQGKCQAVQK